MDSCRDNLIIRIFKNETNLILIVLCNYFFIIIFIVVPLVILTQSCRELNGASEYIYTFFEQYSCYVTM